MKGKIILGMTLLLIFMVGCTRGTSTEEINYINIPTAATTGSLYPFGNSIANLWNQKIEGIKANAQASNGGIDNLNLLQQGEAHISMAVSSNVYQSLNGLDKFENRPNEKIRVIAGLYYNPNQVVVVNDGTINSLSDLKGKSFVPGTPGSTTEVESAVHFKAAGLAYPDEIKAQFVGFTEAIDLMRNRQIDGAWIMAGTPTSAVSEMLKTTNTKLLEIPEELVNELKVEYPWYTNYTISAGTYEELEEDINTSAIKMVMFTSSDMDDDLIYELTKVFWENLDELKISNSFLEGLTVESAIEDIAELPIHEGALRYYREIGVIK